MIKHYKNKYMIKELNYAAIFQIKNFSSIAIKSK